MFTTKGVKNDVEDPAIYDDQIIGKVVGIVPIISPVNHIVKSQIGFFLCVFCPIVIIISLEVFATLTEMKEEKLKIENEDKIEDKEEVKFEERSNEEVEFLDAKETTSEKNNNDEELVLKVDKFKMIDDEKD